MPNKTAPFGLLLDVDGPIASPETRTMSNSAMPHTLAGLANADIPIAFNTGRGAYFLDTIVLPGMVEAGVRGDAPMLAATEKGGIISKIVDGRCVQLEFAPGLSLPEEFAAFARELVETHYADAIYFDEHKDIMVSLESFTTLDAKTFRNAQRAMDDDIAAWFSERNFGFTRGSKTIPDQDGNIQFRIDEHIIGTDVEPIEFSKALGAQRIIAAFQASAVPIPQHWFTVGDSRSDYTMADWLHEQGYDVTHVDVRPGDGLLTKPYPILTINDAVNDNAGQEFLAAALAASATNTTPTLQDDERYSIVQPL